MTQAMHEQGTAQQAAGAASDVAATTKQGVMDTAGEAAQQAKSVAAEVKTQVGQLSRQTTEELRSQAENRSAQAAQGLRSLANQMQALSSGRTEEAGQLLRYLGEGQNKIESFAQRLEQRGPQGLMDDVAGFARRRPGMFLAGAIGAGFVVGRMIRANSGQSNGNGNGSGGYRGAGNYYGSDYGNDYGTYGSQQTSGWDAPSMAAGPAVMTTANPTFAADVADIGDPGNRGPGSTAPTAWSE
jgi:hypothetical protein